MNVVSKEPAVKRFQVIVVRSVRDSTSGRWFVDKNQLPSRRRRPFTPTVDSRIHTSSTRIPGGSSQVPPSSSLNPNQNYPVSVPPSGTSRRPVEPPDYYDSHETSQNPFSRKPIGFFHGQPCPIPDYCLNGGTCSLYETLGEYVCQ